MYFRISYTYIISLCHVSILCKHTCVLLCFLMCVYLMCIHTYMCLSMFNPLLEFRWKKTVCFGKSKHLSGEGNGTPLQYSCLENPMDGGAWWAPVCRVMKSRTGLSNFAFTFHFRALEKEMATHSSVLAWRIPGMGEPGGLPSVGSHRGEHD